MALEADIELLGQVPTLRLLGPAALRILAISADAKTMREGDFLFREGEAADGGYVVASGSFALKKGEGTEAQEGVVARRGTLLGETAILVETAWPGTAIAAEPSRVLRIPRSVFLRMLEGEPEGARKLRERLKLRLDRTIDEIEALRTRFEIKGEEHDDEQRA
jgi:CRP-like cAMP-binding protein